MKRDRIVRVVMTYITLLTLSTGSIVYGDSSTSILPVPQSTISAYRYVQKKIVVGSATQMAFGIVPVNGSQFYLNEYDLASLLSLYQITLNYVGVAGKSFPALTYQISDPYIGKPTNIHPFRPSEPVSAYGHFARVEINGVYVGSVAVVSDHPNFPGISDADAEYDGAAFGVGATLDNISAQDLMSVFKLLNVNSTLTNDAWTFPSLPSGIPQSMGSGSLIYVGGADWGSLLPVSVETHQEFQPISFAKAGFSGSFSGMVITPDAHLALITDDGFTNSQNFVYPLNLVTGQEEPPIPISAGSQEDIAITPNGKMAYVTNIMNGSITPLDLSTLKSEPPIDVAGNPLQIVISPDGKTAYVEVSVAADEASIVPINLSNNTVGSPVGNFPESPHSPSLMNNCSCVMLEGKLYLLMEAPNKKSTLIEFDPATGKTIASIDVGSNMYTMALAPDGKTIYLMGFVSLLSRSRRILAFDVATKSIAWELPWVDPGFNGLPAPLLISPDGKTAYVGRMAEVGTYLIPIDLVHHKVLSSILFVDSQVYAQFFLGMAPDQPPTAVFTMSRGKGNTVMFDASGSKSDMPIAKYFWNFGDGTTAVSSVPTVKHMYAKSGTYTVTLTETDTAGATVNNPMQFNGHMVIVNAGSAGARVSHSVTLPSAASTDRNTVWKWTGTWISVNGEASGTPYGVTITNVTNKSFDYDLRVDTATSSPTDTSFVNVEFQGTAYRSPDTVSFTDEQQGLEFTSLSPTTLDIKAIDSRLSDQEAAATNGVYQLEPIQAILSMSHDVATVTGRSSLPVGTLVEVDISVAGVYHYVATWTTTIQKGGVIKTSELISYLESGQRGSAQVTANLSASEGSFGRFCTTNTVTTVVDPKP